MLGLIKPVERTDSGHRLYGEDVFPRLRKIQLLQRHHSLSEIKEMLDKDETSGAPDGGESAPSA